MSDGLKTIKIGFFVYIQKEWMGGVNYFKNLFDSIKKLNEISSDCKIIPYIKKPDDEDIANLFKDNCSFLEFVYCKNLRYRWQKLIKTLTFKKFNPQKYIKCKVLSKVDISSHNQFEYPEDCKAIPWIPDFQHLHLKNMFSEDELKYRDKLFNKQIKKGDLVIVSSYDALNDFKNFAPEYIDKARVLHFVSVIEPEIYQRTDELKESIIKKFNLPDRYFYIPNQFWEHKNHKIVFEAMAKAKKEGIDINLICTGFKTDYRNTDYFNVLTDYAKQNNIYENIKILGLVDNIEVYYLMRNCISVINPSLFEGWSTTVEEAKSLGKNMILSSINVHKEQNPPETVYFDPYDSSELKEILIDKWKNSPSAPDYKLEKQARDDMQNRIIEYAKQYKQIVLEALNN